MQIIDRVEINYFRSIYSININKTSDINLFVGANDAGKSNLLKALNLFFNNQSELNYDFDFLRDLCRHRADEARSAKGRATIWIRITFNNFQNWRSLPQKFSIKRSWNRYDSNPAELLPNGVPSTTIGRFLSGLAFHYIPAVRSREIFGHYLEGLHDSLMEDEQAGVQEPVPSRIRIPTVACGYQVGARFDTAWPVRASAIASITSGSGANRPTIIIQRTPPQMSDPRSALK